MISYYPDPVNLTAVFGAIFGIYLLVNVECLARNAVAFVKGIFK